METTSGSIPGNGSSATTGTGASTLNKASAALHSAIDDAARKAKPAIDKYATLAHDATDKLSTAGTQTADWMSAKGESLSATQKQLVEDTCKYVSANPMKSLAIAVAAGFVLSRILK
jgi:ElaB protein